MVRTMAVLGMLGATAGCNRSYSACGAYLEEEALVDTSGDVPIFDWALGTAYAVSVYLQNEAGDEVGHAMWHIQCGGDNPEQDQRLDEQVCIETPLVYGDRPASEDYDTVNSTEPKQLESGVTYLLILSTMIETDGDDDEDGELLDFLNLPERDDPHCGTGFIAEARFVPP